MGHWYTDKGKPQHWIEGKNGKMRDTTLRDARKLNLYPSVTEILNVAAKPALTNWLVKQALESALTLPKIEGEQPDAFLRRVKADSKEQTQSAMDLGTEIHDAVETLWKGGVIDKHQKIAYAAVNKIVEHTGLKDGWVAEKTISSKRGYGGMIDLCHPVGWVIDYKTKDAWEKPPVGYPEHNMQLSAYAEALMDSHFMTVRPKLMNVFLSREEGSNQVSLFEWDEPYFDRFECLLKYWQLSKNYKPGAQ